MNVMCADCGFDPHAMDVFEDLTYEIITSGQYSVDLQGRTNIIVSLADNGGSDVTIEEFINMQPGKEYKIVATNGASTANALNFPASTLYNGEIVPMTNGMTILYTFFTDGHSIYCRREAYLAE